MDEAPAKPPTPHRVLVIGNSNSVMRESYVRVLERIPHLSVTNRSIGSSPNVVLLDYLAVEDHWDYDFIIIETAVNDFIQSHCGYTAERAIETLELFIRFVRGRTHAEIIILTIPTRFAMLAPGTNWQESVYQDVAERFGVPILNGFNLARALIGRKKVALAGAFRNRAGRLADAFGLDKNCIPLIAWRDVHDDHLESNSLGRFFFADHAHVSPAIHALMATLIARYIELAGHRSGIDRPYDLPVVMAASPHGGEAVLRSSSLIARELKQFGLGQSVVYEVPTGFVAYGLLVNKSAVCCLLHFASPLGEVTFDLRYRPHPMPWNGVVVAILNPIGGGDVVVSVLSQPGPDASVQQVPDTGALPETPVAEIGELIIVRSDWRDALPPSGADGVTAVRIDAASWAQDAIAAASSAAAQIVKTIGTENRIIDVQCFEAAKKILCSRSTPMSVADQARLMLLLGFGDALDEFTSGARERFPEDCEIRRMHEIICVLKAEDDVRPEDLLQRAQALVGSGASPEAEPILADGMARFPGDARFFVESAWIPYRQKNWPEAMRRWRNLIDCFPNVPIGYLGMALSLAEAGDLEEAGQVLRAAVSRFPDNGDVARQYATHQARVNG